jgi:threonine aldolase
VVEIAQVTEVGTCYSLPELRELGEFCKAENLRLFMDGARLANAAAHLECDLADLAADVDVLTFGGTKNGAVAAEAVIVMRQELTPDVRFLRKQQMQLGSKMRFIAAQFSALLEDKLWLRNAQHANAMAQRLSDAVTGLPGVRLSYPVQSNAVFASLAPAQVEILRHDWSFSTANTTDSIVRWMTAFDMTDQDVDAFSTAIRATFG